MILLSWLKCHASYCTHNLSQKLKLSNKTVQHYDSTLSSFSISLLRFGERFPPLNNAYSKELRKLAKDVGQELDFGSFLREGVYACVGGPSFETTAELNYLHKVHDLIVLVYSKAI